MDRHSLQPSNPNHNALMPNEADAALDFSLPVHETKHPNQLPPFQAGQFGEEGMLALLAVEQSIDPSLGYAEHLPLDDAILAAVQDQSSWGEQVSHASWGQVAQGIDAIIDAAQQDLKSWFQSNDWHKQLIEIMGDGWHPSSAEAIVQGVVQGDLTLKKMVQILPEDALPMARGAFEALTNTIYLSAGFVERHSPEAIKAVLFEEFGHYLDAQLNQSDTPGDEGERFAAMMMGMSLSPSDLQAIQAEDDHALLVWDQEFHWIEQSAPNFAIRTEGTFTMNGSGDLDGDPLNLLDDALVYAAKGYTINGNPALPVQRDAAGNVIRDANGKPLLVPNAVTVSPGYTVLNGPTNKYAGLNPPTAIPLQQIDIPVYSDLQQQTLRKMIPTGMPEIIFDASRNPINNLNDWISKFPTAGTTTQPKVVRVINGGLNIPKDADLSNMVVKVENGAINFNGSGNDFNNVVLIAHNGNINLNTVNGSNLRVFASGAVNVSGAARFNGLENLIATGSSQGHVTFNGSTRSFTGADQIRVIAGGNITFNGSAHTRGKFTSVGTFTFNGSSALYGAIAAKSNITFNGVATVIYAEIKDPNQAPSDLQLTGDRVAENVPTQTVVGTLSTTDGDPRDAHVYELVAGDGALDNGAFKIVGNQLQVKQSPDFETQDRYSIRVRSTDLGGLSTEKVLTVSITNVNEAPIALALSGQRIAENAELGTVIGQLSGVDPDFGDSLSYSLVDDAEGRFQIVGDQLQVKDGSRLDFEDESSHPVTIRVTDAGGLSRETVFAIALTNVNETPVFASLPIEQATVGERYTYRITTTDPDIGDTRSLSILNLPDWLRFTDNGDGTGVLSGTPGLADIGNQTLELWVEDAGGLNSLQTVAIAVSATLREVNVFNPELSAPIVIPTRPSILQFKIAPQFDRRDSDSIRDAFEMALVV